MDLHERRIYRRFEIVYCAQQLIHITCSDCHVEMVCNNN